MAKPTRYRNISFLILCILILIGILFYISYPHVIIEGLDPTEFITVSHTLLYNQPLELKNNLGVSFVMNTHSANNGDWKQILGITPNQDGSDARIFGAWICPNNGQSVDTIYLKTATTGNDDDNISAYSIQIPTGQYIRFDILFNLSEDGTQQTIDVYKTNMSNGGSAEKVTSVTLPPPKYRPSTGYTQGWLFTSYKSFDVFDGTLKNVVAVSGDTEIVISNINNAIDYGVSDDAKPPEPDMTGATLVEPQNS